jgi:hypothetical protein
MVAAMSRTGMGPFARWVLLCALALGVVAMHHVPAPAHDMSAMPLSVSISAPSQTTAAEHLPASDGMQRMQDMLHMCLAVLGGLLALGLALFLLGSVSGAARPRSGGVRSGVPARAPPWRRGRDILGSACVLRV